MNFKNLIYIFILVITLASCGTSRRSVQLTEGPEITPAPMEVTEREEELEVSIEEVSKEVYSLGNSISEHAKAFLGTRYKFGGTTDKGMDSYWTLETTAGVPLKPLWILQDSSLKKVL